jgi:hypothetical protein
VFALLYLLCLRRGRRGVSDIAGIERGQQPDGPGNDAQQRHKAYYYTSSCS